MLNPEKEFENQLMGGGTKPKKARAPRANNGRTRKVKTPSPSKNHNSRIKANNSKNLFQLSKKQSHRDKSSELLPKREFPDLRDTNQHGLIVDHKNRNLDSNRPPYQIGRVLGSGMIGVACLCQDED
jgi:hypothetical protein